MKIKQQKLIQNYLIEEFGTSKGNFMKLLKKQKVKQKIK